MIERILEPEVMDNELEAQEYDQMDFTDVNTDFALLASKLGKEEEKLKVLDIGTGTGQIPIILADFQPNWHIIAIDLARSMLTIAEKNIQEKNKSSQITVLKQKNQEKTGSNPYGLTNIHKQAQNA